MVGDVVQPAHGRLRKLLHKRRATRAVHLRCVALLRAGIARVERAARHGVVAITRCLEMHEIFILQGEDQGGQQAARVLDQRCQGGLVGCIAEPDVEKGGHSRSHLRVSLVVGDLRLQVSCLDVRGDVTRGKLHVGHAFIDHDREVVDVAGRAVEHVAVVGFGLWKGLG